MPYSILPPVSVGATLKRKNLLLEALIGVNSFVKE